MPLFEYRCQKCSKDFELFVQSSTEPSCPDCCGKDLVKKLSVFSVGSSSSQDALPCQDGGSCGSCGFGGAGGCPGGHLG